MSVTVNIEGIVLLFVSVVIVMDSLIECILCKQTTINSVKEVVSSIEHVTFSQVVDSQNENKDASGETEGGVDIDETLQDELCELWDMSMNSVNLTIESALLSKIFVGFLIFWLYCALSLQ